MESLNRVLSALERAGTEWEGDGTQYHAYGICHDGDGPGKSLSITYRPEDRATYLYCHAHGCDTDRILGKLKIGPGDLFDVRLGEGLTPQLAANGQVRDRKPMRDFLFTRSTLATIPPPEPLIDGWVFRNSLVWIAGSPKSGKSLVALEMAYCMANGFAWNGVQTKQGDQLYVVAEGGSGFLPRLKAVEHKYGKQDGERLHALNYRPQLLSESDMEELSEIVLDVKPSVIWLDTQAKVTVGVEENNAKDMGLVVESAERLRSLTNSAVVLVHHIVKANATAKVNMRDIRGSGAISGAADTMIGVHKTDSKDVHAYVIDHKESEHPDPFVFEFRRHEESVYLHTDVILDKVEARKQIVVGKHREAVAKKVLELDAANVPLDASESEARRMGISGKATILREALQERKDNA